MSRILKKFYGNLAVNLKYAFSNVFSRIFKSITKCMENMNLNIKIVVHGPNTILKCV